MYNLCFVSDTIKAAKNCDSQHEGGKLKWQRTQAQIAEQKTAHRTTCRTILRTTIRTAHRITAARTTHRIATVRTAMARTNLLTSQLRMPETDMNINS